MSIRDLGLKYNALQMRMGSPGEGEWSQTVPSLFSKNFTKTANGRVLVENLASLEPQISQCRIDAGTWHIDEKDIIPSEDNKKCTLRYIISTEKAGRFDVIAILTSLDGKKIDAVDEVFYQIP